MSICVDCLEQTTMEHICADCERSMCDKCWRFGIETYRDNKKHDIEMCRGCNKEAEIFRNIDEIRSLRDEINMLKQMMKEHLNKQNKAIAKAMK